MDHEHGLQAIEVPSKTRIARALVAALLVAVIVLFAAVLPAGYGIDPLRIGRALGLVPVAVAEQPATPNDVLSTSAQAGPFTPQGRLYKVDSKEFKLGPNEWFEYKYRIEKGGTMMFSWSATATVSYDMHSEPDGARRGYAQSFEKGEKAQAHGTYTAPFPGIHGWYWKNPGKEEVILHLTTAGFYSAATEFRARPKPIPHELADVKD